MTRLHGWCYFDIETTGLEPENSKIITIQHQLLLYDPDGKRFENGSTNLHILKEWEDGGEKAILKQAYDEFLSTPEKRKDFTPIGNNLSFEGRFLKHKLMEHGIMRKEEHLNFGRLWSLDLRHILIPINNGYGTYPKLLGKNGKNKSIGEWYDTKQYDKIEEYIIEETQSFVKVTDFLMQNLPRLYDEIMRLHND